MAVGGNINRRTDGVHGIEDAMLVVLLDGARTDANGTGPCLENLWGGLCPIVDVFRIYDSGGDEFSGRQ